MADDLEDDQWLYGETPDLNLNENENDTVNGEENEQPPPGTEDLVLAPPPQIEDEGPPGVDIEEPETVQEPQEETTEDGEVQQNGDDSEKDEDDDDSDDDVNVVIGDIKTATPSYTSLNIKRGGLLTSVNDKNKQLQPQPGKFVAEEFEQIGTINGVPATEFNVDSLEEKPWRKPGADITDYFNYGFNEDTWRAYCERQKRMRVNESGAGLIPMNPLGMITRPPVVVNDNSKYNNNAFIGTIQKNIPPPMKTDQIARVNTIQVMTADRREYSRKPGFPDMSVPPPGGFESFQPEYGFNPEPEPFYGGGYEPTQDSQWGTEPPPGWAPSDLKQLTGPPPMGPPPMAMGPPPLGGPMRSPGRRDSPHKEREKERDRDRDSRGRSEKPRDRERERSHRRERSRSRSRRHRSKSRSPSHRSHKKKKSSRRHEDSD